ncbi:gliding motility lipoprotein GldH [Taibaiella sp. KBW10]|uniref:gliding motility lipoprotein GldH n=1 Tax=Taibaiella sp. KBW10 TaxID=2153357 RepID=UPI000F5B343D|nr:gliding motility lipoprotein GldH [Taibaiella sp. KBW10]RQO31626.1 gliding motility lipoprotein GldH [Taibaiella sp. KBW10]
MKYSYNKWVGILSILTITLLVPACGKPKETAFQKQLGVPGGKWDYKFQPNFTFDIPDTTAKYKVYLIVRHDAAFPNANIWVRIKTKMPEDKQFDAGNRKEAVLSAPDGQWLGSNIGALYEHKILLTAGKDYPKFSKKGTYNITLEQIMRENPLPSVVNIGLRVERLDIK